MVSDQDTLTQLNAQFVDSFRRGSWKLLEPVLAPSFRYLDGASGELWEMTRYIDDIRANPAPTIAIDQLVVHLSGDVAVVSARSSTGPGQFNRYLDSYHRHEDEWLCYSACVWPLQ